MRAVLVALSVAGFFHIGRAATLTIGSCDLSYMPALNGTASLNSTCPITGSADTAALQAQVAALQRQVASMQTMLDSLFPKFHSFEDAVETFWSGSNGFASNTAIWPGGIFQNGESATPAHANFPWACARSCRLLPSIFCGCSTECAYCDRLGPAHSGDIGNSEATAGNQIIFAMKAPVSVTSFAVTTRCHPGGVYLGNAKLYGSLSGSVDGTGASWIELAHVSGDGVCTLVGPASITISTPFPLFRATFFGASRGTYESFSHLSITLAQEFQGPPAPPLPGLPPAAPPPAPPVRYASFQQALSGVPWSGPNGYSTYSGPNWPGNLWTDPCGDCSNSDGPVHAGDIGTSESTTGNWIIFATLSVSYNPGSRALRCTQLDLHTVSPVWSPWPSLIPARLN